MHLYVYPPNGDVRVSAPESMTTQSIEMFVRTKLGWIKKQKEAFIGQERQTERQYASGETLYLWGKQYFLHVQYSYKGNSLLISGDDAILTVRAESTTKQKEAFVKEWYRSLLKKEVEKRLPKWKKNKFVFFRMAKQIHDN